jgi:uncharacterized membrane protein
MKEEVSTVVLLDQAGRIAPGGGYGPMGRFNPGGKLDPIRRFGVGGRFGSPRRVYFEHGWRFGFWGHFIPLLVFLLLIGLVVWAVLRLSGRRFAPAAAMAGVAPAFHRDPALEEVRLRYARGEMNRDDFIERWRDLGGQAEAPRTSGMSVPEVREADSQPDELPPTEAGAGEPPAPEAG